ADASAARACATDAVSSSAESSATTSPACTRSPGWTRMAASWPPTSGATRISVVRTIPTSGAAGVVRPSTAAPGAAATTASPSTTMSPRLRLGMGPPPGEIRRQDRKDEVSEGKKPQTCPIARDLGQARAKLVDTDETVDPEMDREDGAEAPHRLGERL